MVKILWFKIKLFCNHYSELFTIHKQGGRENSLNLLFSPFVVQTKEFSFSWLHYMLITLRSLIPNAKAERKNRSSNQGICTWNVSLKGIMCNSFVKTQCIDWLKRNTSWPTRSGCRWDPAPYLYFLVIFIQLCSGLFWSWGAFRPMGVLLSANQHGVQPVLNSPGQTPKLSHAPRRYRGSQAWCRHRERTQQDDAFLRLHSFKIWHLQTGLWKSESHVLSFPFKALFSCLSLSSFPLHL